METIDILSVLAFQLLEPLYPQWSSFRSATLPADHVFHVRPLLADVEQYLKIVLVSGAGPETYRALHKSSASIYLCYLTNGGR